MFTQFLRQSRILGVAATLVSTFVLTSGPSFAQQFQNYSTRGKDGAVLGGLTGAVLGGIAGHQNKETVGGIAIGSVVGAVAGGLLGQSQDQAEIQQYQYQQQVQQAYQERIGRAVSMQDAIMLSQNGLGTNLIVTQIRDHGVTHRLTVSDIIHLHKNGVSEPVIDAMQGARLASAAPQTRVAVRPAPIVTHSETIYFRPGPPVGRIHIYGGVGPRHHHGRYHW